MKIKMKRFLGIILSLALIVGLMPLTSLTVHADAVWTDCYPDDGEYVLVCNKYPDKVLTYGNYRFQLSDYTGDAGQKWTLIRLENNKPSYVIAFRGNEALDVPCWEDDMNYGDNMSTLSWHDYGKFSENETNVFRFSQIEGGPTGDKFAIRVVSEAEKKYDYVLGWDDSRSGYLRVQQYNNTQTSQYWSFVPAASYYDSEHEHTIEYVQDGNSIIATCTNETGLCLLKDKKAVVEIVPPSNITIKDSSSGDDRKAQLVISGDERSKNKVFTVENTTKGEIRYYKATLDGTTYKKSGNPLGSVPKAVGDYVAEVDVTVNNVKYTLSTGYSIINRVIVDKDDATSDCCPTNTFYSYSLSQQIYGKDEVGAAGSIKGIDFYYSGDETTRKFEIYMIETDKEAFGNASDWVPISSDNKVFEGDVTFKANEWNTITFDTPFEYSGDKNLLLCVRDITGSYKPGTKFKADKVSDKAIYAYNDSLAYDISNPGGGNSSDCRNMIRLDIDIINNSPAYMKYQVNSSDTADTLKGKVVHFNGKDWYLIKDDSKGADDGTVTLLAADTSFGRSGFADGTNVYSNSTVKRTLDGYTDDGEFKDVAKAIINTPNGRLYLLSSEEAQNLPVEVLKADFTGGDANSGEWWLRTAAESHGHVAYVKGSDGSLGDAVSPNSYGVRPALTLDLTKVTFDSDTNTFLVKCSVNITPGINMTKTTDSGDESQTDLTGSMEKVVYTADEGYYFPKDYIVDDVNGISVNRDSFTQITVSGTPTADASITLTAPTEKTKPDVPTTAAAVGCVTADNKDGKLTGVTADMEYKKSDADGWTAGTGKDITGLVPGTYYVRVKATDTALASEYQEITIEQYVAPIYKVTYKVVNGTWSDDSIADKTENVQSGSKPASVPTGMKAGSGYTGGAWDTDPAGATITGPTTFTYTFTVKQAAPETKEPETKEPETKAPETKAPETKAPEKKQTEPSRKKLDIALNAGLKISQTGSKINIKWGRVKEADGYNVYVTYCGTNFGKPVWIAAKNTRTKATITKIRGSKIKLTKNFKVYVEAYKKVNGKNEILAKTITGHIVGRLNSKCSNAKKITLDKNEYTLAAGKTATIKAKTVLVDKGKKQLSDAHTKEFRYASSDESIAKVSTDGTITGVAKGTCMVYVYARNGYAKKVSVTVK